MCVYCVIEMAEEVVRKENDIVQVAQVGDRGVFGSGGRKFLLV